MSRKCVARRRLRACGATVFTLALVATACGSSNDAAGNGQDGALDEVVYLTSFGDTSRENYARVADKMGFFTEAGLSVTIEAGAGGDSNNGALAAGQANFAAVDSSGALTRYVNGEDDSFQVLAAVHQQWPMALLALEDTGIERARDLNGRTIGLAAGTIAERIFPTWAELAPGVDPEAVTVRATNPQTQEQELIAGQLDAIALFSVSAPGVEQKADGRTVTAISWSPQLPDMYGNVIVASKQYVANNPDVTQRFIEALMRGLEYTLEHPEEAAEFLVADIPVEDAEVAERETRGMAEFVYAGLTDEPVGYIDMDRLARQLALLSSVGEITGDFNPALTGDPANQLVNLRYVPGAAVQQ